MNENNIPDKCKGCAYRNQEGRYGINPKCQYCNEGNNHITDASKTIKPSDNIDVTGCEFSKFSFEGKYLCKISDHYHIPPLNKLVECDKNPNCHYKQLQQAKVKYNNYIEIGNSVLFERENKINKLQAENEAKDAEIEELKELLSKLAGKTIYIQNDASIPQIFETFKDRQIQELESNLNKAIEGLENICNPLKYLKKVAEKSGAMLNSGAVQLANDSTLLKEIATQTLEEVRDTKE